MIFQGSSSMSYLSKNNFPIVIFTETFDSISDSVCRWLLHYKQPFVRLNYNEPNLQVSEISNNLNQGTFILSNCGESLCFDRIRVFGLEEEAYTICQSVQLTTAAMTE